MFSKQSQLFTDGIHPQLFLNCPNSSQFLGCKNQSRKNSIWFLKLQFLQVLSCNNFFFDSCRYSRKHFLDLVEILAPSPATLAPLNPRNPGKNSRPNFMKNLTFNMFDDDLKLLLQRRKAFEQEIEKVTASSFAPFCNFRCYSCRCIWVCGVVVVAVVVHR